MRKAAQAFDFGEYAIKIGEVTTEIIPNDQWYIIYSSNDGEDYVGGGYFENAFVGYFGEGDEYDYGWLYMSEGPDVIKDDMYAEDIKEYLVRFIPTEVEGYTEHDTYYVQFGDGYYIWISDEVGSYHWVYTYPTMEQGTPFYVYSIPNYSPYMGFNGANKAGLRLRNYGSGEAVQGSGTDINWNNVIYSYLFYPVELVTLDDYNDALTKCINTYLEYMNYTFKVGTTPGCYGEAEVGAFEDALSEASVCVETGAGGLSTEELIELRENLIAAYEAVLASYIPKQMEVKEGYYWICRGADYYSGGELVDMGMYVYDDTSADISYACYSPLDDTSAWFLWQITDAGDRTYEVKNMITLTTFNDIERSKKVTLGSKSNTFAFDYEYTNDRDEDIVTIRQSTMGEGDYGYLWGSGMSTSATYVWGYKHETDPSVTDYQYTLWRLVEVDDDTAQEIIDLYSGTTTRYGRYANAQEMKADFLAKEALMTVNQMNVLGEIYDNLIEALEVLDDRTYSTLTTAEYNAIVDAYDAFIAAFVDPTELAALIEEAEEFSEGITIGKDPGTWSESGAGGTLLATIEEAEDYYIAGSYTQEAMDSYLETLRTQMESVLDAAIQVQEGKWYEIRYATEAEINANNWDSSLGAATSTSPELYGKYVCVANCEEDVDGIYTIKPVPSSEVYDVCVGQGLFFAAKADMTNNEDIAKFRFIAYEDSYIVQNKATGLFLKASETNGAVTLSVHPTVFDVSALGYGENLLAGSNFDGTSYANLSAQQTRNRLSTASTNVAGSNSGLFIEDTDEAVEESYDGTEFHLSVAEGAVYTLCYPVSITSEEATLYGIEVDGTDVTLLTMPDNTVNAGQPCVMVYGELDDYEGEDAEEEILIFTHKYDINPTADAESGLVGNYYTSVIGLGKAVASGNTFEVSSSVTATAGDNTAYIDGDFSASDTINTTIGEGDYNGGEDAIADIVAGVTKSGNIYSIDGKLLGKGNINTARRMGKGLYIVNGVKVVVR